MWHRSILHISPTNTFTYKLSENKKTNLGSINEVSVVFAIGACVGRLMKMSAKQTIWARAAKMIIGVRPYLSNFFPKMPNAAPPKRCCLIQYFYFRFYKICTVYLQAESYFVNLRKFEMLPHLHINDVDWSIGRAR